MEYGYARVSSDAQAQGQSVSAQIRRLQEAGIPRNRIVVEVASATKSKTSELFKLFKRAERGEVTVITSLRLDRFARTRTVQARIWRLIKEHGVKFRFLDQGGVLDPKDPASCFQFDVLGAAAVYEQQLLSQRTRNGLEQTRLLKRHHGKPPWGYICQKGQLLPDPDQWDNARAVITEYIRSGSSTAARRLKQQLTGQSMAVSGFSRWILCPPLRGGVVRRTRDDNGKESGQEIFWNCHEPLILPGEYEQIQALRKSNKVNSGAFRKATEKSIGSGLFVCAGCSGVMSKVTNSQRTKTKLRCRQIKDAGCPMGHLNWIPMDSVAEHIRRAIRVGAKQLADAETPTEVQEPAAVTALKQERDEFRRMKSARAQRQADELDREIEQLVAQTEITSEARLAMVNAEFQRLSDRELLANMSDDDLRNVAVRYGLQFTVHMKKVVQLVWTELGAIKPAAAAYGDLSALDAPVTSVRVVELPMP